MIKLNNFKFDKETFKILGGFILASLVLLFLFNWFLLFKIESKINNFNNIEGEKNSYFSSMKLKFKSVNCSGLAYNAECKIENPEIDVLKTPSNPSYKLFEAENATLNNLMFGEEQKINIDLNVKNINMGKIIKDRMSEGYRVDLKSNNHFSNLDKNILPVNSHIILKLDYLGLNKASRPEYKGLLFLELENKIFKYNTKTDIFASGGNGKELVVNTTLDNFKTTDPLKSTVKLPEQPFAIINKIETNMYSKQDIGDTLYSMYYLLLAPNNPMSQGIMNTNYFGITENRILEKKEFLQMLTQRLNEASLTAKNENRLYSSEYLNALKNMVLGNIKEINVKGVNVSGTTVEEQQIVQQLKQTLNPDSFESKDFKFTVLSK